MTNTTQKPMYDEPPSEDELRAKDETTIIIEKADSSSPPLSEDHDTPFSEPRVAIEDTAFDSDALLAAGKLDPTHPITDSASDIDSHQWYDEGLAGAAEAEEPNASDAVVDYDPPLDRQKRPTTTSSHHAASH